MIKAELFIIFIIAVILWTTIIVIGEISLAQKWHNVYKKRGRDDD